LVLDAAPDVLNHNIETVPRLYRQVRFGARYARSIELLRRASEMCPAIPTKSGLMLGLGETSEEVLAVLRDLRAAGVRVVTIGQYLRPTPAHLPVLRYRSSRGVPYVSRRGPGARFSHVESGPLVRSSYHAAQAL